MPTDSACPIGIRHIDHIVLRVRDVEALIDWYGRVLGCRVERRQDGIGLVQLRAGSALLDLVAVDGKLGKAGGAAPGAEGRNLDHFCFRVEPFDEAAIRAHLQACGVAAGPVEPRYGAEGEGPSLYLQDPEGNTIELKGPTAANDRTSFPRRREPHFSCGTTEGNCADLREKWGPRLREGDGSEAGGNE